MHLSILRFLLPLWICVAMLAGGLQAQTGVNDAVREQISSNFQNLSSEVVAPDTVVFYWNNLNQLNPEVFEDNALQPTGKLVIRYKKDTKKDTVWNESVAFSDRAGHFGIKDFSGGNDYVWQVGTVVRTMTGQETTVWSSKEKFETEGIWNFWDFLILLGALGLFIYGMKIMSEGLQKLAGNRLRGVLKGMTSNRATGVLTGTFVTSVIQSSSATTVMVVSFVNAGLLTLSESMGVIMGANIGTTITAWLVAYLGFKVKIVPIATIMVGLSFPLLFVKKEQLKHLAEFIIGFGILFIGLDFLKDSVPDIKSNPQILEFLNQYTDSGYLSILLFIFIGTLLTVVVQSSSASTAITLIMLNQGWIEYDLAAAMVLGENIGTTITANIAASIGNVYAKRAARFHTLFNLIGVGWMLAVFPFFVPFIETQALALGLDDKLGLALFHSSFNLLNVFLLLWFIPYLEKLVIRIQPSKGLGDEEFRLRYISAGLMSTPELSLAEAKKELQIFAKLIDKMSFSFTALLFQKHRDTEAIIEKIKKREEITDDLELELTNYLTKISESDLSRQGSERVRDMLSMANDLERMADIFYMMTKNYQRMDKQNIRFREDVVMELKGLMDKIHDAIKLMRKNMELDDPSQIDMEEVYDLEKEVKSMRKKLVKAHYNRLEKNLYTPMAGVVYLDYVVRGERIVAHIVNVNESLSGIK